jgi:hypothetical protein
MWKHHAIYKSQPCSVIVTFIGYSYMASEVVPTTTISMILKKQCRKVISQATKFVLFIVQLEGE